MYGAKSGCNVDPLLARISPRPGEFTPNGPQRDPKGTKSGRNFGPLFTRPWDKKKINHHGGSIKKESVETLEVGGRGLKGAITRMKATHTRRRENIREEGGRTISSGIEPGSFADETSTERRSQKTCAEAARSFQWVFHLNGPISYRYNSRRNEYFSNLSFVFGSR